ncbi:hypothetical protein ANN_04074 [Periplaneta americana]|uniref:PiggyBac transposable element-derived protein domain-containing protein n=1 Tax=Periplaneta americana TaxID=6978 RepID=A0ABQ8T953_PERAM|nr:hypothetical protein ANN_04074 [Periplaneta americana]
MDLREVGYDDRDWINLAQDRDRWRAYRLINKMTNLATGVAQSAEALVFWSGARSGVDSIHAWADYLVGFFPNRKANVSAADRFSSMEKSTISSGIEPATVLLGNLRFNRDDTECSTDDILHTIINHTNKKLDEMAASYGETATFTRHLDELELKAFIGLVFLAGIFKSNHEDVDSFFATEGTGRDIFRATMTKERYLFLLSALRFDNIETREERKRQGNKLAAISEVFDRTNRNVTGDDWFTSVELMDELRKIGLMYIGTVRKKKKKKEILPQILPDKKREVGSTKFGFTRDKTIVSFVPKKSKAGIWCLPCTTTVHQSEDDVAFAHTAATRNTRLYAVYVAGLCARVILNSESSAMTNLRKIRSGTGSRTRDHSDLRDERFFQQRYVGTGSTGPAWTGLIKKGVKGPVPTFNLLCAALEPKSDGKGVRGSEASFETGVRLEVPARERPSPESRVARSWGPDKFSGLSLKAGVSRYCELSD